MHCYVGASKLTMVLFLLAFSPFRSDGPGRQAAGAACAGDADSAPLVCGDENGGDDLVSQRACDRIRQGDQFRDVLVSAHQS